MPNFVLTGLPRSGSSLTCHLLNRCADTVALLEPIDLAAALKAHGPDALPEQIEGFLAETRRSLLENRRAVCKTIDGSVPDNFFGEGVGGQLRRPKASRQEISFEGRALSPDFTLAVKHNAAFAAQLDRLRERFPCRGIVRHPLAMLASWNTVQIPIQQGYLPMGQRLNADLGRALARIHHRTERQFYILDWFFEQFTRLLPREHILRYEDLIASGGRALETVTPAARALDEPLASRNQNPAYPPAQTLELGQKLLGRPGAFWEFYSRESVEEMLAPLRQASAA